MVVLSLDLIRQLLLLPETVTVHHVTYDAFRDRVECLLEGEGLPMKLDGAEPQIVNIEIETTDEMTNRPRFKRFA